LKRGTKDVKRAQKAELWAKIFGISKSSALGGEMYFL
jgi:hypothetical protein